MMSLDGLRAGIRTLTLKRRKSGFARAAAGWMAGIRGMGARHAKLKTPRKLPMGSAPPKPAPKEIADMLTRNGVVDEPDHGF